MVRLGGAYYGNPYNNIAGEKGSRFQLSGGLGYRDKGFFIDLAYVHTMGKDVHFAYRLQNAPSFGSHYQKHRWQCSVDCWIQNITITEINHDEKGISRYPFLFAAKHDIWVLYKKE